MAIWACILVPRWARRTHQVAQEPSSHADFEQDLAVEMPGSGFVEIPGSGFVEVPASGIEAGIDAAATAISDSLAAAPRRLAVGLLRSWRRPAADPLEPEGYQPPTGPLQPADAPSFESRPPAQVSAQVRSPISRSAILQARRRLLTTLVTLAIAASACTAAHLTSPWVLLPPTGMLGMYLLLLREAARCDAESAHRRQEARAARTARQRAREAWAARVPEPTAQIIDISSRVGDQLYDQYADATVRAVGD